MADGLEGRVAVVTGALGNLGPVWTAALTDAGATVVGLDVQEAGGVLPADVTDRVSLEQALEQVSAEHGTPSVLVNNAGIDAPPGADEGSFGRTLAVNVEGVFNATQVFGGPMCKAGRGSIVNVGSLYASVAPSPALYDHIEPPFTKPAAYGASKAAVVNLTRYFARLWGPYGVRVNALSPGGVRGGQDEEFVRKYSERVPLGRMAEPRDLVGALLFLASDASAYVTGHELRVDGGFTA
ncbi:MAG TPA: SDR family oxidoreductase [Gaiellaceae bacterium]|nr:SDR family oxidoreductase [Gaiellaceae bacterium]